MRKLVGMNFIAQSIMSSACDDFRLSIMNYFVYFTSIISLLAVSWLSEQRMAPQVLQRRMSLSWYASYPLTLFMKTSNLLEPL